MLIRCFIYNPFADKKIQRLFYIFNRIVFFRCGEIHPYFPLHTLYGLRPVAKLTYKLCSRIKDVNNLSLCTVKERLTPHILCDKPLLADRLCCVHNHPSELKMYRKFKIRPKFCNEPQMNPDKIMI